MKKKVLWLSSHPVQYTTPLFKEITKISSLDFQVLYLKNFSISKFLDKEFNKKIKWDINLLRGHKSFFYSKIKNYFYSDFLKIYFLLKRENYKLVVVTGYTEKLFLYALIACKILNIRTAIRCEANNLNEKENIKKKIKNIYLFIYFKLIDDFLYIGKKNKDFYKSHNLSGTFTFLPYCVDNNFFKRKKQRINNKILKKINLHKKKKNILFVGKFIERKNPFLLVKSFSELALNNANLILVGDGNEALKIKRYVKRNKINNIKIFGFQNQNKLRDFYDIADYFVLPSSQETWGLVTNEALNYNLLVLTTKYCGSSYDLIQNNKNGIIIQKLTKENLKGSIIKLLKFSKKNVKKMNKEKLKIYSLENNRRNFEKYISNLNA